MSKLNNKPEYWEKVLLNETVKEFEKDLEIAEEFTANRPPKVNITLRLDPIDLSLLKRKARMLGIAPTQVMTTIIHQALQKDKLSRL